MQLKRIIASIILLFTFFCFVVLSAEGATPSPLQGYADLVEAILPSVVSVSTTSVIDTPPQRGSVSPNTQSLNEFIQEYFDQYVPTNNQPIVGHGSGFIIDKNGVIVTNYHVIRMADDIEITTQGNDRFKATLIAADRKTDIAILKINPGKHKLRAAVFADSDQTRVGDAVIAIGSPLGLGGTVTSGIVSAISRQIGSTYVNFIQTDASINQGNSGGPLYNASGEVIGMNTAIFSQSGGNIGLGFAIPSNVVKYITGKLQNTGSVTRGWLGVSVQGMTPNMASSIGLTKTNGAFVAEVMPDSPAKKAGIKASDVIIKFDGKPIQNEGMLPMIVGHTPIGKSVEILVWRNTSVKALHATITPLPVSNTTPLKPKKPSLTNNKNQNAWFMRIGLAVEDLTEMLRSQYPISKNITGVMVTEIDNSLRNSLFRSGDIIMSVQKNNIHNTDEFIKSLELAEAHHHKTVLVNVWRANHHSGMSFWTSITLNNA